MTTYIRKMLLCLVSGSDTRRAIIKLSALENLCSSRREQQKTGERERNGARNASGEKRTVDRDQRTKCSRKRERKESQGPWVAGVQLGEYKSRANTEGKRISVVGVLGARRSLMYETFVSRVGQRQFSR